MTVCPKWKTNRWTRKPKASTLLTSRRTLGKKSQEQPISKMIIRKRGCLASLESTWTEPFVSDQWSRPTDFYDQGQTFKIESVPYGGDPWTIPWRLHSDEDGVSSDSIADKHGLSDSEPEISDLPTLIQGFPYSDDGSSSDGASVHLELRIDAALLCLLLDGYFVGAKDSVGGEERTDFL